MYGHHENSTKVDLLLTEPSQVSEPDPEEGEELWLAQTIWGDVQRLNVG